MLRLVSDNDGPDPHAAFADDSECVEDMVAWDWSWPCFTAGALCGLVAGILAIAVPAIIVAGLLG